MYQTIIGVDELSTNIDRRDWIVVDCRYDLAEPSSGYQYYLESHIVGAVYADLTTDLSGRPVSDHGRHPLPTAVKLCKLFSSFGIDAGKQVIIYDASSGAMGARMWWLLRYMGHEAVAVLDGGWQAWQSRGLAVEAGERKNDPVAFIGSARNEWLVTIDKVCQSPLLVDARDAARYSGEVEPVDPVAGHIPGAINHCWKENLAENGHFLDSERLHQQFSRIYADTAPEQVVFYCGSGVTACHNLLAVAHAGLPAGKLYAGSWSEWCREAGRPVARGPKPL